MATIILHPQHQMEVRGRLHAPAAVPSSKW